MLAFHIYVAFMSLVTLYVIYTMFRDNFKDRKWYERQVIASIGALFLYQIGFIITSVDSQSIRVIAVNVAAMLLFVKAFFIRKKYNSV